MGEHKVNRLFLLEMMNIVDVGSAFGNMGVEMGEEVSRYCVDFSHNKTRFILFIIITETYHFSSKFKLLQLISKTVINFVSTLCLNLPCFFLLLRSITRKRTDMNRVRSEINNRTWKFKTRSG